MDVQPQSTPELTHLGELIGDIEIAMLATLEEDGMLRSRPLQTLQMDSEGALWFMTTISSPKIGEMDAHRRVNLSYCRPDRQTFVSVSGVTQILRDPQKAHELWRSELKSWLPRVDDPEVVLLKVTVEAAEYWDVNRLQVLPLLPTREVPENQKITIAPVPPR
jgi:general stress protein 26